MTLPEPVRRYIEFVRGCRMASSDARTLGIRAPARVDGNGFLGSARGACSCSSAVPPRVLTVHELEQRAVSQSTRIVGFTGAIQSPLGIAACVRAVEDQIVRLRELNENENGCPHSRARQASPEKGLLRSAHPKSAYLLIRARRHRPSKKRESHEVREDVSFSARYPAGRRLCLLVG